MDKEIEIEELEKDIASLTLDWQAMKQEARTEMDQQRKRNLQVRAKDIKEEIKNKEQELKNLEKGNNESQINQININQNYLDLEKKLSKFNFQSTVETVEGVIGNFKINNGSALFLLQNSISIGGNYFSARFREILRTKTKEGNFRHCLVEFKSVCPTEKIEFLKRFAKFFPTDVLLESIEEYTNQIIEKICESIPQSGYILFLEISGLEYMLEKEKIMPWFVKEFWHNLSTKLQNKLSLKGYRKVRVICLMKTDDIIPDDCLPSYIYYELANFHDSEIKELTIESCSQDEIEDFLYTFGGFNDRKVKQMVQLIHNTSKGGNPDLVCRKLKQFLIPVN